MVNTFLLRPDRMMRWFGFLLLVLTFASGAFAAELVVPQDGIALGEVQPGAAVAAEVVVSNDTGRTRYPQKQGICYSNVFDMHSVSTECWGRQGYGGPEGSDHGEDVAVHMSLR